MADREIVEREVVRDGPGGGGSGLIIGIVVALVVAVILLFVFLGNGGGDDDGGDGGDINVEAPDLEAPDDLDVNVDEGGEGEGG